MGGKKQALLEETKFWPFTSSEETEPDTKKDAKDDKAEDKKATKVEANATKHDENTKAVHGKKQALLEETKFWPFTSSEETDADTKKDEKEKDDKAEDKKATKAKANATEEDENTDTKKGKK